MSVSHQPCVPVPPWCQRGAYRLAFPPWQPRAPRDPWLSLQRAGERQGSQSCTPQCSSQSHGQKRGPRAPAAGPSSGLSYLPAPPGWWRGSKGPQPPGNIQAPAAPCGHPLTFSPLSPLMPQAPFMPRSPCEDEEGSQRHTKPAQVLARRAPAGRGANPPWGHVCPGIPCPPSLPGLQGSRRGRAGPAGEHTA